MKKGIIISSVVVLTILFLSGCNNQQASKNNNAKQKQSNDAQQSQTNNSQKEQVKNNNANNGMENGEKNNNTNNSDNSNKSNNNSNNKESSDITIAGYNCGGQKIKATFNNSVNPPTASFTYDGKNYTLPAGMSGSGVRYTDGSTVFWTHQGDASLSFNGDEDDAIQCTGLDK